MKLPALLIFSIYIFLSGPAAAQRLLKIAQYDFHEFAINVAAATDNPFADEILKGTFTSPSGKITAISGFYDGGNTWKLRFSPNEAGIWIYRLEAKQMNYLRNGKFICHPSGKRGFIQIHPKNPYAFSYHSGQPFFPMGDTSYGLYDDSPVTPRLREKYLNTRRRQAFNFIRMEIGHSYMRAMSEPVYWAWGGTAKQPDLDRYNPDFFKGLDQLLLQMRKKGMNAELILLNFYRLPFIDPKLWTEKRERQWLKYLLARYAAFNNIFMWTISNEYETHPDGVYRLDRPADVNWAKETAKFIKANDPYQHLVTVHPVVSSSTKGINPKSPIDLPWRIGGFFGEEKAIDVLSQQTGQNGEGTNWDERLQCWIGDDVYLTKSIWADRRYNKPVMNTENGYEYLQGQPTMKRQVHHTDKVRRSSWRLVCSGAYLSAGFTGTLAHSDIWNQIDRPNKYTFVLKDEGAATQLSILYRFFTALPYWTMKPFEGISVNASALYNDSTYVVYLPHGGSVLFGKKLVGVLRARWFNPRSGVFKSGRAALEDKRSFKAPDLNDWVLLIEKK